MQFKDYYQILGVDANASDAQIKTAYRRLARKYHPDVSKEKGAEERFKEVNEAYEALRDTEKRKAYDQLRARGYRSGDEIHPHGAGFEGFEFNDAFTRGNAGDFSDFFAEFLGGGRFADARRTQQRPPPAPEPRLRLQVPLQAVYNGDEVPVAYNDKQLQVKIPKGIRAGQVIRLKGQGNAGRDLLLEVHYAAHPQFEVKPDSLDVRHVLRLTPWQAALGATLQVPTLGGDVQMTLPAGVETGRKLRLRGRGLPAKAQGQAGDQIVEVVINAPRPQTDAQRQAYQQLADAFGAAK